MKVKFSIRESFDGHQVGFTIGVQTFYLQARESEEGMTSKECAAWYIKQLKYAFNRLKVEEECEVKCELSKLADFVRIFQKETPLCFVDRTEIPFEHNHHSTALLIDLLRMIENEVLIINPK